MNAHQIVANVGKIASLGLIDRTLVDWYMHGATLEENIPPSNQYIYGTMLRLFPVAILWGIVLSLLVTTVKRQRKKQEEQRKSNT